MSIFLDMNFWFKNEQSNKKLVTVSGIAVECEEIGI